jgi:hypothetical protein
MAIKGIVYDLSKGNSKGYFLNLKQKLVFFLFKNKIEFYGPGGSYHSFAGRDSTRAVAKWSMNEEDFKDDIVSFNINSFI